MKFDLDDLTKEKVIMDYLGENFPDALHDLLVFEGNIDDMVKSSGLIATMIKKNHKHDKCTNYMLKSPKEKTHIERNLLRTIKAYNTYKSSKNNNINVKMARAIASYYGKTACMNSRIMNLSMARLENLLQVFNNYKVDLDLSSKMQYNK